MTFMQITKPDALAWLLKAEGIVPWVHLWHPSTTLTALARPGQDFYQSWCDMLGCLAMAEWAGGSRIVVCARIGPQYLPSGGEMPRWDRAHYEAVHERACEWRAQMETTWEEVDIGIDTERYGGLKDVVFPEQHVPDLESYDYYKSIYLDEPWPHKWWQLMLAPSDHARQVIPHYKKHWVRPAGYLEHRYWGTEYGHTLEDLLGYKNCLMSAPATDEVGFCKLLAERLEEEP